MALTSYAALQLDTEVYLKSIPFFSGVFIYRDKPKTIKGQVEDAMQGFRSVNGKAGLSVQIGEPFLLTPMSSAPGPTGLVELRFLIKMQPTINFGGNGTGLLIEDVDLNIIQAMLEWASGGAQSGTWFPSPDVSAPARMVDDDTLKCRLVKMRAEISFQPPARTVNPGSSGGGSDGDVTLSCAAPDADAVILYTLDGTAPGFEQGQTIPRGTTQVYAAPFAAAVGTVIRAVAIAGGKLPSQFTYDPVIS